MAKQNQRDIESKWREADSTLRAAYARSGELEPKMNGRSFCAFIREVDQAEPGETSADVDARIAHWCAFLDFIFAYGPSPDRTTKRLYAMTWAIRRALLLNMNITEVSALLGEVRATGSLRVNNEFTNYLARWGFLACRVEGQKRESTRNLFARIAKNNTSRRSGRKKGDGATLEFFNPKPNNPSKPNNKP